MEGRVVHHRVRRFLLIPQLLVCACLTGFVLFAYPGTAYAGDPSGSVNCPPSGPCTVTVGTPGSPGGRPSVHPAGEDGSTGEAAETCHYQGEAFPCNNPTFGWWNADDSCFYKETNPPSGPTDPINTSIASGYHAPGDGAYYDFTCLGVIGTGGGYTWLPSPPPGSPQPAVPDPAVLAQRAVQQLGLAGPDIQTSPPAGTDQVVGLPTWLWTRVTATTWGSHSATAAVPGESVTATATAERIVWDLGDGTTVTCAGPGTPYQPGMDPHAASPTCGHTYTASSAGHPGQVYPVTATTTWSVRWAGAGAEGRLTLQRSSQATLRVVEAQAVNR